MKRSSLLRLVLSIMIVEFFPGFEASGGFSLNNNAKMNCQNNEDCTTYCQTVFPGVPIIGTCASDKSSCNCSGDNTPNKRVKVRLVEEKPPVRATPSPPPNDNTDWVPQVLNCNNSEESIAICKAFCQSLSLGGGYCNTEQLTCICSGVHPAVVQPAPIPAIFNFYLQPRPTHMTPRPSMLNEWKPIASSSNSGSFQTKNNFAGNQQPFHYSNPQMNGGSSQNSHQYPPQQGLYQLPSNYWSWQQQYPPEYFQQHFANSAETQTVTSSVSAEKVIASNNSTEGFPADRPPVSQSKSVTSSNSSSPRRKRSAGSSYSNAFALRQA